MPDDHSPVRVDQVMVSSTFTDLKALRAALISALPGHKFHANVMENDAAKAGDDVIDSSLRMVRDSAAYILVIGQKYGQTPEDGVRNPRGVSITELEFDEAVRLGRPVLLFVMGEDYPVGKAGIERDRDKEQKLDAFRERAKRKEPGGKVNRVYAKFDSPEEFEKRIGPSLADLRDILDAATSPPSPPPPPPAEADPDAIPTAPALYAEPRYIGSHTFVGRDSQLQELSDWAKPADPTTLLLFEAIGGNGKSMLTWEWVNNHAVAARPAEAPWAGRFWYSFYERGAVMSDFCQRALAYTTGRPLKEFAKKKTTQLAEQLRAQLTARPWLFILDGLERVLVAYHRIDAAEVPDEEANAPTDKIASRDPCDAIREEDNDLLRALAGARPSKILVSSRLTPRVLLNQAQQTIPGVKRINLLGLRPVDAEALLKSCGVTGDSAAIQQYLTENCDNHPLVVGVLAGLINKPGPCRGNFDAWAADPNGGKSLDLGKLDLIQRRNHILQAAIDAVPVAGRQLLGTLALISDSVDYATLEALNPHLPPEPDKVEVPKVLETAMHFFPFLSHEGWNDDLWKERREAERVRQVANAKAVQERRLAYEAAVCTRLASQEYLTAPARLTETVGDLERRGLLQWDARDHRYNLHPVVRGVSVAVMAGDDKEKIGRRVVDHFTSAPHNPYECAVLLDDLRPGLYVVRTLLKLNDFWKAIQFYHDNLAVPLFYNLESHHETLSILRPLFRRDWTPISNIPNTLDTGLVANHIATALQQIGEYQQAIGAGVYTLGQSLAGDRSDCVREDLMILATTLLGQNRMAAYSRCTQLNTVWAASSGERQVIFLAGLDQFEALSLRGEANQANAVWKVINPLGRDWDIHYYRPGDADVKFLWFLYWNKTLDSSQLADAEALTRQTNNRVGFRSLAQLRGRWKLDQREWAQAAAGFDEAVRLARERGLPDTASETGLALARYFLGQLAEPLREAERLSERRQPEHRYLAMLWHAVGEPDHARTHALAAYKRAWADGEPYVRRYDLTKAMQLLRELGAEIPSLPPYDPAKDPPAPWEADVRAAIDKLRDEKEAEKQIPE